MGKPLTLELLNIWTGGWPLPVVKRNFGCRTFSTFSSLPEASYPPTIPQASQTFLYLSNFSSSSFSSSCLPPATTPPLFLLFSIPKSALIPITQKSFHPLSLFPFSCSFVYWHPTFSPCWIILPPNCQRTAPSFLLLAVAHTILSTCN